MTKRKIVIGEYDTAAYGWTLSGWQLSAAQQKTHYVAKTGGDGSWDLSTVLTDGVPRYGDRTLTATLECSDGDRMSREDKIRHLINLLDGSRVDIELPDDPDHHITGRVHVARKYSDLAHAAVTVTATCEPWRYANTETDIILTASATAQTAVLVNNGRRVIVPTLTVTGDSASVTLTYGSASYTLAEGKYQWPELLLTPGTHDITYSGSGTVAIRYREAVLE